MPRFQDDLLSSVISDCFKAFSLPEKVRSIHIRDIGLEHLDDWDSSPGMPWYQYGYMTKGEVAFDPLAMRSIAKFWDKVKRGQKSHIPQCTGPKKTILKQKNRKRTVVFYGYPCTAAFQEACFAVPLLKGYRELNTTFGYRYKGHNDGNRRTFCRFQRYSHITCFDYKSFDKTLPDWLVNVAFDVLASNINWTKYQGRDGHYADRLYKAWKRLIEYFLITPAQFRNGTRYKKNRGLGSGSYFTEMIYSIVNYIVTQYCVRFQDVKVLEHVVLADESLIATSSPLDISFLIATAGKFDMVINLDHIQVRDRIDGIYFMGCIIDKWYKPKFDEYYVAY